MFTFIHFKFKSDKDTEYKDTEYKDTEYKDTEYQNTEYTKITIELDKILEKKPTSETGQN